MRRDRWPDVKTIDLDNGETMNMIRLVNWCTIVALVAILTVNASNQSKAAQSPPGVGQDGVEVLTRGPVHEAFAETVTFDPEPGIVVPKAPPADIEEVPPEQRPEGSQRGLDSRLLGLG